MGIFNFRLFRNDAHYQFEQLVSPHLNKLYKLAFRLTVNRDDAEDLVQDLLIKVYPRLEEMQKIEKLPAWLSRILYRLFIDKVRRDQRSPIELMGENEAIYEIRASEGDDPLDIVNSESNQKMLTAILQKLKEEQRILIMLHDVEGYSLQEINEITGIEIGTIKSRLSRSRKKMREMLKKRDPSLLQSVNTGTRL